PWKIRGRKKDNPTAVENTTNGTARKIHEDASGITISLRAKVAKVTYGKNGDAPLRPWKRAFTNRTMPAAKGATSKIKMTCAIVANIGLIRQSLGLRLR